MVQKAAAGVDLRDAAAVETERERDVRFRRGAGNGR